MNNRSLLMRFAGVCMGAMLVAVIGCSKGPPVGMVKGTVTLDGKPPEDGTVRLAPFIGHTSSAGGIIKSGQFMTEAPIGKYRVEISATKIAGGGMADGHSGKVETVVQLVPERYNTKSELTPDVISGLNEPHFDLKSR